MSEEGGTSVSAGFFMSYEDALRPFCFEKDESSHEEDRFDKKSGRKAGTEKVVDVEAGTYVKIPGVEGEWGPCDFGDDDRNPGGPSYDGTEGFLEALAGVLGCEVETFGGEYPWVGFNVAVKDDYANDSYDACGHWSAGPSIYLSKMAGISRRAKSLSKKMVAMGFKDPGEPVVYNVMSVAL